jgi:hypothetical protein
MRATCTLLCGAVLSWSAQVLGQRESVAEALFRDARAAMKAGDLDKACPKFAESQRLDPSPGTLLNLAICEERLGRVATAWVRFRELLDTVASDDPRARIASEHLAALGPSLPQLRLSLRPEPGQRLVVALDGVELDAASLDVFLPVDPGQHRIVVSDDRGQRVEQVVTVPLGGQIERELVLAAPQPDERVSASPLPQTEPVRRDRREPPRPAPSQGLHGLEIAGFAAGGAGIAALGVAGYFALDALALKNESNADGHCDSSGCDPRGLALRQEAVNKGDTATLLSVTGGVVAAGGVALYFLGRSKRSAAARPSLRLVGSLWHERRLALELKY